MTGKRIDYRRRTAAFERRWNVRLTPDAASAVSSFQNRACVAVDRGPAMFILQRGLDQEFVFRMGIRDKPRTARGALTLPILQSQSFANTAIHGTLSLEGDLVGVVHALQTLFWVLEDADYPDIETFAYAIREAMRATPGLQVALARRGNHVTLHPRGAAILDDGVVNDSLAMMHECAAAARHFEQALEIRMAGGEKQYTALLNELRRSLEELARKLLGNRRSLEKNETEILRWVKSRGAHNDVVALFRPLLSHYVKYQNDAAKHGEKWSEPEIDFMIYLTGTFIRFLVECGANPTA